MPSLLFGKQKTMEIPEHHIPAQLILFFILYGGSAVAAVILCVYLLLRKGNAIAAEITPPMRLRRWAAAFFGVAALIHVWWLLFYIYSWDFHSVSYAVVLTLDCVTLPITIYGTLLSMLQDRERSLWPVFIALIPLVVMELLRIIYPSMEVVYMGIVYFLSLSVLFTIYIVIAVRQYGRWLRDNYADLEYKEVWLSHMLIIIFLLFIVVYGFSDDNLVLNYLIEVIALTLFALLLWRVETLPKLEVTTEQQEALCAEHEPAPQAKKSPSLPSDIGQRLAEQCVDTQLYVQHDLTLHQLAMVLGTNRSYLSQYFSGLGLSFNIYINDLRINHFIRLYQEAVASQRHFTAQQLASASGYRSYSTFSLAFKQRMGQSVTAWMHDAANQPT